MNNKEAAQIMRIEQACVLRQDTDQCNRDELGCQCCDLIQKTEDVLEAYDKAFAALMKPDIKECPVCGKAYAYTNVCPACNCELRGN